MRRRNITFGRPCMVPTTSYMTIGGIVWNRAEPAARSRPCRPTSSARQDILIRPAIRRWPGYLLFGRLRRSNSTLPSSALLITALGGAEFSRPLHQEACENIRNYPREHLACTDIASFHANALDFDLPDGDWVAFLFNPFAEDVLRRVAQRIVESRRGSSGRAYVIFGNSDRMPVLRNVPGLKRIHPRGPHALLLKALAPVPFEFFVVELEQTQSTTSALGRKKSDALGQG